MIEDLTRTAAVFTTLSKTELVFYAMSGSEKLGCAYSYNVTLLSENPDIGLSEILGQPICVVLRLPGGSYREFSGFVTRFTFIGGIGRHAAYQVQVEPWLALLRQRAGSRIYQGKTVPVVIEKLFREHGFSDFTNALTGKYRTFDYLVQYRESDLDFLLRIMRQEGIYFFFKHHDNKHELVLADSLSAHEATAGYEKVPYYPPQKNEKRERDHLHEWFVRRGIRPGIFSARDFNFTRPSKTVKSETRQPLDHAFNEYEVYDYPGEFQDEAEADVHTRIRLEEEQASFELVQGGGNARGLQCGALFGLEMYPRKDQNKEYLIIETTYTIQVANYDSLLDPDSEPEVQVTLVAQDSKTAYRAPRIADGPTIAGPQTATVVGPKDQEIWTDEYGRVRLQFHWDREGKSDENSSCWVRVSQTWAGQKWGSIHIPRIGQEVVVSFLEGNPNRPLVTGRVYNANNMPPYDLTKNQTQSGIKSHSTKGGTPDNFNEIRFEDKKGDEELHIQAEKNMTTLVKHDQSSTVRRNRNATVRKDDQLSVEGNRSTRVTGNRSATIGGNDSTLVDGSSSVTVQGDSSLNVTGNYSFNVKGEGSGPIKSNMSVTGKYAVNASDSVELSATNLVKLSVGGDFISIEPSKITISVGGSSVTVTPSSIGTVSSEVTTTAGGSNIAVTKSSVDTKSDKISADGGGSKLELASGGATVKGAKVKIN